MKANKKTAPFEVKVERKHIWPDGTLGKITITGEYAYEQIEMTLPQALSLAQIIQRVAK